MPHEFDAPTATVVAETTTRLETVPCDALVVFLTEGGVGNGAVATIDRALGGVLSRLAAAGEITGRRYECVPVLAATGLAAGQVVVAGLGKREAVDAGVLHRAAAMASRHLAGRARARVAFACDDWWSARQVEQAVAGAAVGMVGQDIYRAERKRTPFGTTIWVAAPAAAVATGATIAAGVNLARRLINTSPDDMYPQSFADEAAAGDGRRLVGE